MFSIKITSQKNFQTYGVDHVFSHLTNTHFLLYVTAMYHGMFQNNWCVKIKYHFEGNLPDLSRHPSHCHNSINDEWNAVYRKQRCSYQSLEVLHKSVKHFCMAYSQSGVSVNNGKTKVSVQPSPGYTSTKFNRTFRRNATECAHISFNFVAYCLTPVDVQKGVEIRIQVIYPAFKKL